MTFDVDFCRVPFTVIFSESGVVLVRFDAVSSSNRWLNGFVGVRPVGVASPLARASFFDGVDFIGVRRFAFLGVDSRFAGEAGYLAELSGSEEVSEGTGEIDFSLFRFLETPFDDGRVGVSPLAITFDALFLSDPTDVLDDLRTLP